MRRPKTSRFAVGDAHPLRAGTHRLCPSLRDRPHRPCLRTRLFGRKLSHPSQPPHLFAQDGLPTPQRPIPPPPSPLRTSTTQPPPCAWFWRTPPPRLRQPRYFRPLLRQPTLAGRSGSRSTLGICQADDCGEPEVGKSGSRSTLDIRRRACANNRRLPIAQFPSFYLTYLCLCIEELAHVVSDCVSLYPFGGNAGL